MTVRRGPGLVGTMARTAVVAGTATATVKAVGGMGGSQQKAAAQQQAAMQQEQMADLQANQEALAQQQAMLAQQQAAGQEAADSLDAQLVQIQKLAALKDQGVLTEEEFQAKKAQILGI